MWMRTESKQPRRSTTRVRKGQLHRFCLILKVEDILKVINDIEAAGQGKALFGRFDVTRPASVLMIQLELSEAGMHKRFKTLSEKLAWSPAAQERFHLWCGRALLLDRRNGPKQILGIIESLQSAPM
jgi:hypothetical protein